MNGARYLALPLVALKTLNFIRSIPATNGSGRTTTERQLALCVALPLVALAAFDVRAADPTYELPKPRGWSSEVIQLPPGFAPAMKWTGTEDIRFAPGMFKPDSDSFFSYAVLFWLDKDVKIDDATIEREVKTYYAGLSAAVLKGKNSDKKPLPVELSLRPPVKDEAPAGQTKKTSKRSGRKKESEQKDDKASSTKRIKRIGKLTWREPFATAEKQTLRIEIDVWRCVPKQRTCVIMLVSPQAPGKPIWKELKSIRDKFACHAAEPSRKDPPPNGE